MLIFQKLNLKLSIFLFTIFLVNIIYNLTFAIAPISSYGSALYVAKDAKISIPKEGSVYIFGKLNGNVIIEDTAAIYSNGDIIIGGSFINNQTNRFPIKQFINPDMGNLFMPENSIIFRNDGQAQLTLSKDDSIIFLGPNTFSSKYDSINYVSKIKVLTNLGLHIRRENPKNLKNNISFYIWDSLLLTNGSVFTDYNLELSGLNNRYDNNDIDFSQTNNLKNNFGYKYILNQQISTGNLSKFDSTKMIVFQDDSLYVTKNYRKYLGNSNIYNKLTNKYVLNGYDSIIIPIGDMNINVRNPQFLRTNSALKSYSPIELKITQFRTYNSSTGDTYDFNVYNGSLTPISDPDDKEDIIEGRINFRVDNVRPDEIENDTPYRIGGPAIYAMNRYFTINDIHMGEFKYKARLFWNFPKDSLTIDSKISKSLDSLSVYAFDPYKPKSINVKIADSLLKPLVFNDATQNVKFKQVNNNNYLELDYSYLDKNNNGFNIYEPRFNNIEYSNWKLRNNIGVISIKKSIFDDIFINISLKMILAGAYDFEKKIHNNTLQKNNLLPLANPYSPLSKYYNNKISKLKDLSYSDSTDAIASINYIDTIVDWVGIKVLSINTYNKVDTIFSSPAFLTKSGHLKSVNNETDKTSGIKTLKNVGFYANKLNNHVVYISHRNHLDVMTKIIKNFDSLQKIDLTRDSAIYNFNPSLNTNATSFLQIDDTTYALWPGDFNKDNIINTSINPNSNSDFNLGNNEYIKNFLFADKNLFFPILDIYSPYDINLDGIVDYSFVNNSSDAATLNNLIDLNKIYNFEGNSKIK